MGSVVSSRKKKKDLVAKANAVGAFSNDDEAQTTRNANSQPKTVSFSSDCQSDDKVEQPTTLSSSEQNIENKDTSNLHETDGKENGVHVSAVHNRPGTPLGTGSVVSSNICTLHPSDDQAATLIQKTIRGHLARKQIERENKAAVTIQKHYRGHASRKTHLKTIEEDAVDEAVEAAQSIVDDSINDLVEEAENLVRKNSNNDQSEGSPQGQKSEKLNGPDVTIGGKTKENLDSMQDEINELKWRGEQQVEKALMEDGLYSPQKLLLIASNVPKPELLLKITSEGIVPIVYDFSTSFEDLLNLIVKHLDDHVKSCKIHSIAFICQGGPGHVYLLKGKVCTNKKMESDEDMKTFFQSLSHLMSKLDPSSSHIYFFVKDLLKNKEGKRLMSKVEECIQPAKVKVLATCVTEPESLNMMADFVDSFKYKIWLRTRHSRIDIKL